MSSDPPCKDGNALFKTAPNWKIFLIKHELYINVFVSLNCLFSFAVSLWKWLLHSLLYIGSNRENPRKKKKFWFRKTMLSSTFVIRIWCQGNRYINRLLPSLHGELRKIMLTVPLMMPEIETFSRINQTRYHELKSFTLYMNKYKNQNCFLIIIIKLQKRL